MDSTILVVDDSPENIFSLKTLLELHKYNVDTALSGEEALRKVLRNTYALIILDVQMPEMDGFEVAEALGGYSKAKEIPIIFLSAVNTHKKFITKGYNSGGLDYVTKPFDPEILLLKVKTFVRLYDQTRELNRIGQVLRDEVKRKTVAESGLKQSVDELRSILQSIPQLAFTTDADGKIQFANNKWYEYAGASGFPETRQDSLTIEQCLRFAILSGISQVIETSIRKSNDVDFKHFLLGMTPVQKDNVIVKWVGIFTDIHEQKTAEQLLEKKVDERTSELQVINQELESRNSELQQFAFVASHDLQEPLRKIQVFSNILKDKFLSESEDGLNYVTRVISSSDRMRTLINDLLNYSRLSGENLFTPVDLNETLDAVTTDLDILIKSKNATVNTGTLTTIDGIATQLQQVFANLITNAIKFSKEDSAPVININAERVGSKSADASRNAKGDFVRIKVTDNGIGFSQEYAEKIFTIFQRLSSQKKYEGTGIGLAIVRKVIDRHKGSISAFSEEGKGAEFIITLPLRQPVQ